MLNLKKFHDTCGHMVQQDCTVWVAYSGGIDSHVLLHLARQTFKNLRAIHINHNLSPNAKQWEQHCDAQCAALDIDLVCVSVDATPNAKQSPEDAAREARRAAWLQVLGEDDVLLTAHHADDQAETILYRLFRGTGPTGLIGMQQQTKVEKITVFRPLLQHSKQDVLNYAAQHNLQHIVDESNANSKFDRNFIRNEVMPLLQQRWPAVQANINRAGVLCAQMLDCLQPEISEKLAQVIDPPCDSLNITRMLNFSSLWHTEILRAWLLSKNVTASVQHLTTIMKEVVGAAIDANPQFLIGGKVVRRFQGRLYILDFYAANETVDHNDEDQEYEIDWNLQETILLPCGIKLTPSQLGVADEYLQELRQCEVVVKKGSHGTKAKKLFQLFGVPVWERSKYPLVFADGRLVAIIGLWAGKQLVKA